MAVQKGRWSVAANAYDAIVIGGGHNGLAAAAYLAGGGARTIVLEARHKTGGAASTDSPWEEAPDFRVTTYSYVVSLMPEQIVSDLELERFGYKVYPMGPYYLAFPDGRSLIMASGDDRLDHESISRFSKKDADTYPEWREWMGGMAKILAPLLLDNTSEDRLAQASRSARRSEARVEVPWARRSQGR